MLKRSLRIKVMAAMFSAAFLFGIGQADAYTYSGITKIVDKISEDNDDLIINKSSKITCKNNVNPQRSGITKSYKSVHLGYDTGGTYWEEFCIRNLPTEITNDMANEIIAAYDPVKASDYVYDVCMENDDPVNPFSQINAKYGWKIDPYYTADGEDLNDINWDTFDKIYYKDGKWCAIYGNANESNSPVHELIAKDNLQIPSGFYKLYGTTSFVANENANIIILGNSLLNAFGNVQTSKSIKVTENSFLKATGAITGGDIYSDKAIISTTNDQGESIITPGNITATGALKSDTYIGAVSGAVSGNTVYSGGNVVSANSIKAGGLVKGNALNVAAINATTASITGNQSINGIFTTTGQAMFNGGAALGGKKITGLSIGTLSTTSTDAVNGKQLYTAMQSSGKTYTAGSDISISSANAISVAKAGKVASGDTSIMTGDAVYQETSKINSVFKANNTSITSNNSKLDNLTTSIESLRKSLGTINSSVSDAISGLPGSLANFANKDLTDLSDTGINTLKSYIKSEIKKHMPSNSKTASYAMEAAVSKDTSAIDNVIVSKANASDLTALGSKVDSKADKSDVSLVEDRINDKVDLSYVNDGLAKKADQSVVEAIGRDVDRNTSAIAKNTELIQSNTEAIAGLNDSKADISGSNIDASSWSSKLGNGVVAKDDTGLVTGSSAATALDKKADLGYVAIGLGAMESSLDQMSQQVTKDVSRVGAGTSALMGLHPTGDKFEFATAYGHYKNSNNTALGVFYKPTANSTVSMAATIGDGDAMLSAGVSIKLGLNKEVKKVITPEEFGAMKTAVDSQDEKLDQMEKTLQQLMAR